MSRCVCKSSNRETDGRADRQRNLHNVGARRVEDAGGGQAGLTRFKGVIDWAGDSSLPSEQGAAEAHVVSRVADAELGHEQLPGWLLHQESVSPTTSFSRARRRRRRRPPKGYLWACILYFRVVYTFRDKERTNGSHASPRRTCSRLAESSSGCFSSDSGFLPEVEGAVAFTPRSEFVVTYLFTCRLLSTLPCYTQI